MKINSLFLSILIILLSACSGSKDLNQNQDAENLSSKFQEIKTLSESESCDNSNEWTFVAYGSKACGGPQGYIAYSKNINVQEFLKLVETYTAAEEDYNNKWNIVSDCSFVMPPLNVSCEESKAVLVY